MKQQRKITDEDEARSCLAAARRTGDGVGAWARANGVDGRSLNAWRVNLARRGSGRNPRKPRTAAQSPTAVARPRAALVELVTASRLSVTGRYVVHVGEVRVELGDDFAPDTLRRIVEVLRAC